MKILLIIGMVAMVLPLCAAEHTIESGEQTFSGITESERTVKKGAGTMILSGDNTLYGLQVSAGTLRINGGTTTVTGPGGTTGTTATFAQAGGTTIIEGGATLSINKTSSYGSVNVGGVLMVTNGTYDAKATQFLNAFSGSAATQKVVIQDKGVLKCGLFRVSQTSKSSDDIGLFLNAGGKLYTTKLGKDGNGRAGVIRYNGGTIYKTESGDLYVKAGTNATTWDDVKSYVDEGGFHIVYDQTGAVTNNVPLFSGVANDGGVHYSSSSNRWFYLGSNYKNSTFNGGTWIEGNAALIDNLGHSDAAFGTPPTSPANNIFFIGSPTLFTGGKDYTINRNRNIWIDAGSTATIGCNSSGTGLRIGGTISVPDGEGAAHDTMFNAGNSTWGGFIVFDPGEGRTNRLDKLHVVRNLEIASGVTIVRSPTKQTETAAPLYVEGNNSAYTSGYNSYGNLKVSGGKLIIEGNRYFQANKYANVIVEGGTVSALTTYCEYLNGLSDKPATLTVGNGGVFEVYKMRVSQGGSVGSDVNINAGGVLRTAYFFMDNYSTGRINLNGGTIAVYSDSMVSADDKLVFLGGKGATDTKDSWKNVTVRVLAGGAKFDTAGYSRSVNTPLLSAVDEGETDGGLTKLGEGTLTMTTNNTYNGVTRLEGGTLKFTHANGLPDGDIEFSAAGLASATNAPLLMAKALSFRAGCGIRVTECDTLNSETWTGYWHTVATFDDDIAALPSITFVKSDDTVASAENGWDNWTFRISANRKSIEFKRIRGTMMVIR